MKKGILIFGMTDSGESERIAQALFPALSKDRRSELKFVPDEECGKTIGELSDDLFAMPEPAAPLWEEIADPFENRKLADPKAAAAAGAGPAGSHAANGVSQEKRPGQDPLSPVPPQPVMVFVRLTDAELDDVLASLREAQMRIPHKAVLTPYNAKWTARQLYAQIEEERKAVRGNAE